MKQNRNDKFYLQHIYESILQIENYTENIKCIKEFLSNKLVQDAVIRQLEIIGEASKKVSMTTRKKYDDIPWKEMTGMRDKLIHEYFGVNIVYIWETVNKDLPDLKQKFDDILNLS